MEIPQVLRMNGGDGEVSYYQNSSYQKKGILAAKPILEESIAQLLQASELECLTVVDMGCSSGPNTLLPLWEIIETVDSTSSRLNRKSPILQVFLNDLPGNDFNTIFTSLIPNFHEKLEKEKGSKFGPCFIAAMPGSFYGRLFPPHFLHFAHSSYSLHWLSQVPEELATESGIQLNKGTICLDKTSPPSVHKAYMDQFQRDFTTFLRLRSEEMISGGQMVLTFLAQSNNKPYCKYGIEIWQLIGLCLKEMVEEGLVQESALDSCNLPLYAPSADEVRCLTEREGSFTISRLDQFELNWDVEDGNQELACDRWERGKIVAARMRAVAEPMLASHFGDAIIDDLFLRLSIKIADCLEKGIGSCKNQVISMIKK
ncbi:hypothetical protein P3X46_018068 [Hevea brasiliensis]|uniref:Jasmonate O-methyltransferase n=1 Tax=Hevea brasiliensis TaxID=3981 RepID=A0ABQ9LTM4_HEVBR|nr:probable caffeine synthase MTL2 [Hevea brasiliensis]KAJ9169926.1 hypothetical protein P3X46_018068 [Hevea brasiliensis]